MKYPLNYGEEPLRGIGDVFPERDQFDFALLAAAEARNIPVFAICRGCQIVNVYRGDSLYQDLSYDKNCTIKHSQNQTPALPTHTVEIEPDSKLAKIIGTTTWITNSHHHQTCRNIGESLVVTSHAKDGTVEALEIRSIKTLRLYFLLLVLLSPLQYSLYRQEPHLHHEYLCTY